MTKEYEAKYKAAMDADKTFQAAVIRQFGKKNAGTMRYIGSKHNAETKAAATRFWEASATWLDAMQITQATRRGAKPFPGDVRDEARMNALHMRLCEIEYAAVQGVL